MGEWGKPTQPMINYACKLLEMYEDREGPYHVASEDVEGMSFDEVSELIDNLKFELGLD